MRTWEREQLLRWLLTYGRSQILAPKLHRRNIGEIGSNVSHYFIAYSSKWTQRLQEKERDPAIYSNDKHARSLIFMKRKSFASFLTVITLIAIAGCSGEPLSTREKGTLVGGALGAGGGAAVGAAAGHPGAGAAIGGVGGAAAGYGVGNQMQNQEDRDNHPQPQYQNY
jgi:osmotically inducible lipoprotein OsmB